MSDFEREDKELEEIFSGEEKPMHPDTVHVTIGGGQKPKQVNTPKAEQKPCEAQWEPVRPDPNWLDKLKDSVKWVGTFAGLCALFFYWQQSGQMAASAAVPSMCACCTLAGIGVGKNVIGGGR